MRKNSFSSKMFEDGIIEVEDVESLTTEDERITCWLLALELLKENGLSNTPTKSKS